MSEQRWHSEVSRHCIGAGLCVSVAPDHFEFTEGRAQSTTAVMESADDVVSVRRAAAICPARAIAVTTIQGTGPS